MDSTTNEPLTFENYLKGIPIDKADVNLIKSVLEADYATKHNQIAFRAILPAAMDTDLLLSLLLRWISIKEHFMRDVRIYALSANPKVEKHLQALLANTKGVYLTVVPIELREVFYEV